MLIDEAVAKFRATNPKFTVERSLVNASKWIVKDSDGTRITSGLGHSLSECEQIKTDATTAAKLSAALEEIVSVRVLSMALMMCDVPDVAAVNLARRLVPAFVDVLSAEDGPVGHG